MPTTNLQLHNYQPTSADFLQDVVVGLREEPKQLPCKYFYDQRGCELFDQICELDEYYLTRTELSIMARYGDEMADELGPQCILIEYGSGSSTKTRILLDAIDELVAYVPVDIAREHLQQTSKSLSRRYPGLRVLPVCADFTAPFDLPRVQSELLRRVVYFPGSTIGNLGPHDAQGLLNRIASVVGRRGGLLIGIDLEKEEEIMEAAYNDELGVTADFNLNVLRRINGELDANFELDEFEHRAFYNPSAARVEMHLVSRSDQSVSIGQEEFEFEAGESIRTEYSHKYTTQRFGTLAAAAGFELRRCWTDENSLFAVLYLELPADWSRLVD